VKINSNFILLQKSTLVDHQSLIKRIYEQGLTLPFVRAGYFWLLRYAYFWLQHSLIINR